MEKTVNIRRELFVCLFLVAVTLVCYWQVQDHEFVNFDDEMYITHNPNVQAGLISKNLIWAFTTTHACNWHPLTWLSHMADCTSYKLDPAGRHLTNLLFHIATVTVNKIIWPITTWDLLWFVVESWMMRLDLFPEHCRSSLAMPRHVTTWNLP